MDPIIKTARVSSANFSLGLRRNPSAIPKSPSGAQDQMTTPVRTDEQKQQHGAHKEETPAKAAPAFTPPPVTPVPTMTRSEPPPQKPEVDLEALRREAIAEGREQGIAEGRQAAQDENKSVLDQLGTMLLAVRDAQESLLAEVEDTAVDIVFEAVTKIVGQAAVTKDAARYIVQEAVEQARGRQQLTVRVSPRDFDLVQAAMEQARGGELTAKEVHVVPDNIVHMGGCVIETEAGSLDARLEIKMQRLKDTLLGVRKSDHDE